MLKLGGQKGAISSLINQLDGGICPLLRSLLGGNSFSQTGVLVCQIRKQELLKPPILLETPTHVIYALSVTTGTRFFFKDGHTPWRRSMGRQEGRLKDSWVSPSQDPHWGCLCAGTEIA